MTTATITADLIAQTLHSELPKLACTLRGDYFQALSRLQGANSAEQQALDMLVKNAELAQKTKAPICQDTGYVKVQLEISGGVSVAADVFSQINGVVAAIYSEQNWRKSIVKDALFDRANTGDNTPAWCDVICKDGEVDSAILRIMLKGGGSDNASLVAMLSPSTTESELIAFITQHIATKAANACPPLLVGVGIGSNFDKVAELALKGLWRSIGTANTKLSAFEDNLLKSINSCDIGAGGLAGGQHCALAVHVTSAPCHIAALPVAIELGCCALRTVEVNLL